jgi:hypothetical protein
MSSNDLNALKNRVKDLQAQNKVLADRIRQIEGPFSNKIDPSILIKSIQDDLLNVDEFAHRQERQTTYVVSDLNLQLKALVTKEGSKPLFVLPSKPGEIDPNLLSTVNITLKPIPLNVQPAASPRPVETVEGIGPIIGSKLREIGIKTVSDLARASAQNVAKTGISVKRATEFINMAKFMTKSELAGIEKIDEQAAEVLVLSGKIDSKEKLAESDPTELYNKLRKSIEAGEVKVPKAFSLDKETVTSWIQSAKVMTGITRTT